MPDRDAGGIPCVPIKYDSEEDVSAAAKLD